MPSWGVCMFVYVCVCAYVHIHGHFRCPASFKPTSHFLCPLVLPKHSLQLNVPIHIINIPHSFPKSRPLWAGAQVDRILLLSVYQCEQEC